MAPRVVLIRGSMSVVMHGERRLLRFFTDMLRHEIGCDFDEMTVIYRGLLRSTRTHHFSRRAALCEKAARACEKLCVAGGG